MAALSREHGVAVVVLGNTSRSVDRLGTKLVDLSAGHGGALTTAGVPRFVDAIRARR